MSTKLLGKVSIYVGIKACNSGLVTEIYVGMENLGKGPISILPSGLPCR